MRLDKFLKVTRLIKRRPIATEACNAGKVLVNEKEAKPAYQVKLGDIIEVHFGNRVTKVQVTDLSEREPASENYRFLGDEE